MTMNACLEKLLSVPKSFWVSVHFFGFRDALKLPMLVRYNCRLVHLSGSIKVKSGKTRFGMFHFGFGNVGIFDMKYERAILDIQGRVELSGSAYFGNGSRLCVEKGGVLETGNGFINTAKGTVVCTKRIAFGDNVLMSWDTIVMDSDWHSVRDTVTGEVSRRDADISVGNGVWIGMRSVLLKGTVVPDGCIVAANSTCCKVYEESNCLLAGMPARVKKRNVTRGEG